MRNSTFDFISQHFLVQGEKVKGKGEDSYLYSVNEYCGAFGAFDGSGGAGSRVYPEFANHTGAYIASRTLAISLYNWLQQWNEQTITMMGKFHKSVKIMVDNNLKSIEDVVTSRSLMKGTLKKDFPSTFVLCILVRQQDKICVDYMWAGDSRAFHVGKDGLHQMTMDDTKGRTSYVGMESDGVMSNLISASAVYGIHEKMYEISEPCIVFAASDGCFGYLETPMHFEYLILDALMKSFSVEEWEKWMKRGILECKGDDYTMTGALIGFSSFEKTKVYFKNRYEQLKKEYIIPLSEIPDIQKEEARDIYWAKYKPEYGKYCEG